MINLTRRSFLFDGTGRRGESRFALRHSPRSQELLWAPRRSPQRFFTLCGSTGAIATPRWLMAVSLAVAPSDVRLVKRRSSPVHVRTL